MTVGSQKIDVHDRVSVAFSHVLSDLYHIACGGHHVSLESTAPDFEIVERCAQRAELDRLFNSRETLEARAPANVRRARA